MLTPKTLKGVGHPPELAGGMAKALVPTGAGCGVGFPVLPFYRYFGGRIDGLLVTMEQQAIKMVEVLNGDREQESRP